MQIKIFIACFTILITVFVPLVQVFYSWGLLCVGPGHGEARSGSTRHNFCALVSVEGEGVTLDDRALCLPSVRSVESVFHCSQKV